MLLLTPMVLARAAPLMPSEARYLRNRAGPVPVRMTGREWLNYNPMSTVRLGPALGANPR